METECSQAKLFIVLLVKQEFNEVWGQAWSLAAGFDQSQLETINKAGYYTVLAKKDLRILSFNSNYG